MALSAQEINQLVVGPLTEMLSSSTSLTGTMTAYGSTLLSAIALLVLSWEGVKIAMEMSTINETMGKFVNLILITGITFFLFDNYATFFGQTGYLHSGFNTIAASFGMGGDFGTVVSKAVNSFFTLAGNIMGFDVKKATGAESPSLWEQIKGLADIGSAVATFIDWLPSLIVRAAAALVTIIAGAIFIIQMLLSQLAVVIGAIIGPIMIPWMLIPATSFLFDGWLKFMITAGMWKVVGAIIYKMAEPAITKLATAVSNTNGMAEDFGYLTLQALGILLVVVVIAVLMSKIQELAEALVSGGTVGGISQRWAMSKISGGAAAPGKGMASASYGAGAGMKAYSNMRAGGASKGAAFKAASSYGAKTAGYTAQNFGKIHRPPMPKPPGNGGGPPGGGGGGGGKTSPAKPKSPS